jgi:two-component system nitrate/nitrite response regulator NarL
MSVGWSHQGASEHRRDAWRSSSTVIVIGDDRLFADAVSVALQGAGFAVKRILDPSEDAIVIVEGECPDIVLVEIDASGEGVSLGGRIARDCGGATKVVALSQTEDQRLVERVLRMGFSGYVTKALPTAQFVRSIETIAAGHLVVPSPPPDDATDDGPLELLTGREREVLTLLVRGATSAQIARTLSVSDHTVRTHMQNLFAKLGVRSRVQAASIAVKHGVR